MKFSVSMCVYGGDNPEWFKIAVNSILQQTVKPNEVVLVVDGPVSDELNRVILSFEEDELFKVIRFAENKGHGEARRAGLDACTNEIVAIMDADDISVPTRFEQQLKKFENNPEVDVVGGQIVEFIDSVENTVGKRVVPTEDAEIKQYIKKRCPMNLVTVMFKKASVEKVGGFIDWYCEEDYYLWVRMVLSGMVFANVDQILVNVRVGKEMYNRRGGIRYFRSEARLQKFMYNQSIISFGRYIVNVSERLILQVLMPNKIRGFIFRNLARSN